MLLGALSFTARADGLPKVFPHLTRIRYDGQCLTIDDRDVFIFSASFPYFDCPKALWRERFRKIKEEGCNAVATPVPGNSRDLADLKDWLHMAQDEFGLYTIIGPGAPATWPVIAAEQVTRKLRGRPGVILVQIEDDALAHYRAAVAGGIDVPIFTSGMRQCRDSDDPSLSQVFDTVSLDPRSDLDSSAQKIAELESDQADAPAMVTVLPAAGQPAIKPGQLDAQMLLAIESGATIIDCQTNPVPAAIGRMLREHGAALTRSRPIACQVETASPDATVTARLTRDNAIYLFFRNRSLTARQRGVAVIWLEKSGEIEVNYDLEPFGFDVLYMAPGVRWPFDSGRSVPAPRALDGGLQRVPAGAEWLPKR